MHIYVTSPVTTFDDLYYTRIIKAVHKAFPVSSAVFTKGLYGSATEWLETWKSQLSVCTCLAFFVDRDGYIGRGVFDEIQEALNNKLPVYHVELSGEKRIVTPEVFGNRTAFIVDSKNWKRYARVVTI